MSGREQEQEQDIRADRETVEQTVGKTTPLAWSYRDYTFSSRLENLSWNKTDKFKINTLGGSRCGMFFTALK